MRHYNLPGTGVGVDANRQVGEMDPDCISFSGLSLRLWGDLNGN